MSPFRGIPEWRTQLSFRLVIELEHGKSQTADVDKDSFVIGRSQKCDVIIPEEGLSRQHCLVEVSDGVIYVTDLGSANGVFIDENKIPPNQKTRYFTTSKLTCGTAEIVEFTFRETQDLLQLQEVAEPPLREAASRPRPTPSRKKGTSSDFDKTMSSLHPGVRGFLLLALIGVGFFVFKNVLNSKSDEDEFYQQQYDAAMKNRKNDGSIKTRNF